MTPFPEPSQELALKPRLRSALTTVVLMASVVAHGGTTASATPTYPVAAGETIIHATGIVGIVIDIPQDTEWRAENVTVDVSENTHIYGVYFKNPQLADLGYCDFCFEVFATGLPENDQEDVGACSDDPGNEIPCSLAAGPREVYFVSDGEVTITVRLPGLSGRTELRATGHVDGELERLPVRCDPLPTDCSEVAFGGAVREIGLDGRGGFAGVVAYANAPGNSPAIPPYPSETTAVACAYPGLFQQGKSPDPSRYPYGCDITNPDDSASTFLVPAPRPNGGGKTWSWASFKTHGAQYLGFAIRNIDTIGSGSYGVWGLWLNEGISCPSSDFTDCET